MLINEEEINKYMQQEYELAKKKIRFLETQLGTNHESEVCISIEIPFFTDQAGIDCIVDYVKNEIKPIFKKTILKINSAWFDKPVFIRIATGEPQN